MYIRTKDCIYDTENLHYRWIENNKVYKVGWDVEKPTFEADIINQSENLDELCDEFVFNSDISNYVIDKKFIEHTKAIILKIYKENDETDYVKAMHPKFYGAIWVDGKGLIYVAKMNEKGELELI